MKYYFVLFLLLITLPTYSATGDIFIDNGLMYRVTAEGITGNTAMVDDNTTSTLSKVIIPDSVSYASLRYAVTAIKDKAFQQNNHIDTLDLSGAISLTFIDSLAFAGCGNLTYISFLDSLKVIEKAAFAGCYSLDSICLPSGIVSLGEAALGGCTSLKVAVLSEGITELGPGSDIFSSCWALHTVRLPSTLRSISEKTFSDCTSLKTIHLPDSLKIIEQYAFFRSGIENVYFSVGLNYLGESVFGQCSNLRELDFSQSVDFKTIITGTLPASIMRSLESIIFPPNLETIEESSMGNVSLLKEIILHEGLKKIGYRNFNNCANLEYLRLPATLDTIEAGCFNNFYYASPLIDNLNPIPQKIDHDVELYYDSVFYSTQVKRSSCKLRVPCASIPLYRNAPIWKDFHILDCYEVNSLPNDNNTGSASGSGQFHEETIDTLIATANPTYEFVFWKDIDENVVSYNDTLVITVASDTTFIAYFRPIDASSDATLSSLIPSDGVLVPDFNSNIFNYVDTVPYAVDSIQFHVITTHPNAIVNETDTTKKELSIGENEFTVTVSAEDLITTNTYVIKVYRLNNNAYLHNLQLQNAAISPVFDSLNFTYSAQVSYSVSSVNIIPTLSDAKAYLYGDYGLQNLAIGSNRFDILVRAEDRDTSRTYTVLITRDDYPLFTDANLIQANVNGTDMLNTPTNRFDGFYNGVCNVSVFNVTLSISEGATLSIENPFTITIDKMAGLDTIHFSVISEDGNRITNHRLILEKRFDFDDVVETMWNDNTFMLDIKLLNENNFPVSYESRYLWYKNGQPVFLGIYPTLSAGEQATDHLEYGVPYYLEMVTDAGEKLRTCEKILTENTVLPKIYPNPVHANEIFTLHLDNSEGKIEVFTVSGILILKHAVDTRELKINLSQAGTYIIKHTVENKKIKSYKIIVK